jgi:putative ABC transport system ATP-binding protein
MAPVIQLDRVSTTKQGRSVLLDLSLAFERGNIYSILGPSGAGKTTLLRLLNRLEDPSVGAAWFDGIPYRALSPISLRQRVAMVFQVPVVFPGTVRDNLLVPLRLHQRPDATDAALSQRLQLAGLTAAPLGRNAEQLSVGEKQRVCLARALMTDPEVLLLDEPTAALDPTAARRLLESIRELNRATGLTVIMVSHQPAQAQTVGGQIILLVAGRVVEQTNVEQFFVAPATPTGRSYLEGALEEVAR